MADPDKLFNSRLDSSGVRAIDVFEDPQIDDVALRQLIQQAVAVNREGDRLMFRDTRVKLRIPPVLDGLDKWRGV